MGSFIKMIVADRHIKEGEVWFQSTKSNSLIITRSRYLTLLASHLKDSPMSQYILNAFKKFTRYSVKHDALLLSLEGYHRCLNEHYEPNSMFVNGESIALRDIEVGEPIYESRMLNDKYRWEEEWREVANETLVQYYYENHVRNPLHETPSIVNKLYVDSGRYGLGLFLGKDVYKGDVAWKYTEQEIIPIYEHHWKLMTTSNIYEESIEWRLFCEAVSWFSNYDPNRDAILLYISNDRYMNHSDTNPLVDNSKIYIYDLNTFSRDILAGTELSENYFTYHACPWASVKASHDAEWMKELKQDYEERNPTFEFS